MMSESVEFTYKKTFLITRTMDFPLASEIERMESVSLVTPDWVAKCVQQQKILPKEPYSPDPRHILRDVAISVTGLSSGDTTAIFAAAWALGAQFSSRIFVYTTHLIATSDSLERCRQVVENGYDIKIVLPTWISDCMKLRRRVDDAPYCFPNPSILSTKTPQRMNEEEDEQKFKYTHSRHGSATPPKRLQVYNNIFEGKAVCFGADVKFDMLEQDVCDLVMEMGAGKVAERIEDSDVLVCQFRKGPDYIAASQRGLIVGSLSWIYYMAFHNEWSSPLDHLLHYPLPTEPLPGMENQVISVTNYVGEARGYLEELICALGARYTGQLSCDVSTHLICAYPEGQKYNAARAWNMDIVSHLWLEESYALWEVQPLSNRKYSYLPEKINLQHILGMTKLIPERLKQFYDGKEVVRDNETPRVKAGTPPLDLKTPLTSTKKKLNTYGKKSSSSRRPMPTGLVRESVADREQRPASAPEAEPITGSPKARAPTLNAPTDKEEAEAEDVEMQTADKTTEGEGEPTPPSHEPTPTSDEASKRTKEPGSSSRTKKQKTSDAMGEELIKRETTTTPTTTKPAKKQKPTKKQRTSNMEDSEEITEREADTIREQTPKAGTDDAGPTQTKKQKTSSSSSSQNKGEEMRIILAGLDDNENRKITLKRTKLAKLGIVIVEEPEEATCIIATRRRTSEKFLRALSTVEYVIHPDYLFFCIEQDAKIEPIPDEYWVSQQDEGLKQCIQRRKENFGNKPSQLFKGFQFNMAVGNIFSQLDRVVQTHGALPSQKITAKNPKTYAVSQNDNVIVLAIEDEKDKTAEMRRNLRKRADENNQSLFVYDRGWLTDAIIKMSVQFDDNQLQIT